MHENNDAQEKGVNSWWRAWWQRFRNDFSSAEPEKQVAQIYYITAILAVLGSLLAGLWAFGEHLWPEKSTTVASSSVPHEMSAASETKPAPVSIVALPFVNLSGDHAEDYFADGITDSLTTDLSRALPGSFVVARETAFTYKGKPVDARQIGQALHVRFVLEGSVLPGGSRVRVNAHLIDAESGKEIWSDRFDTTKADVLQVQDEIVGRLSRAVGLQVIVVRPTPDAGVGSMGRVRRSCYWDEMMTPFVPCGPQLRSTQTTLAHTPCWLLPML